MGSLLTLILINLFYSIVIADNLTYPSATDIVYDLSSSIYNLTDHYGNINTTITSDGDIVLMIPEFDLDKTNGLALPSIYIFEKYGIALNIYYSVSTFYNSTTFGVSKFSTLVSYSNGSLSKRSDNMDSLNGELLNFLSSGNELSIFGNSSQLSESESASDPFLELAVVNLMVWSYERPNCEGDNNLLHLQSNDLGHCFNSNNIKYRLAYLHNARCHLHLYGHFWPHHHCEKNDSFFQTIPPNHSGCMMKPYFSFKIWGSYTTTYNWCVACKYATLWATCHSIPSVSNKKPT